MGFEPQVNPLFKALTGCLVAFWLHTVAPAQIKKTPGIFSPEFSYVKNRCAQRCSSHLYFGTIYPLMYRPFTASSLRLTESW